MLIEFLLILLFVLPIVILIIIGVAEYKRLAEREVPSHGFAPRISDARLGLSRGDLGRASRQLIRSDKTRGQMKEMAAKSRGGYQSRIRIQ